MVSPRIASLVAAACLLAIRLEAQALNLEGAPKITPLVTIGSPGEDRHRLLQLLGEEPTDGYLLRTPSLLSPELGADSLGDLRWGIIAPELRTTRNSALPFSQNDGALWAGKGLSLQATSGLYVKRGRLSLIVAPQFQFHENKPFQIPLHALPDRDPQAWPWERFPESIDLPMRFGDGYTAGLNLGQSSLNVEAGPVVVGAATENQWWGPAIRNALVMSNHAAGIPHLFLRTGAPLRTRAGSFEGRWMAGWLRESPHFDFDPSNDIRSFSGFVATYQPAPEPNLTIGVTRAVYAPAGSAGAVLRRPLDVFRDVGRPNARTADDPFREPGPDQVFSVFGRWIFPSDGLEAYAEWARHERPASLRDFLEAPHHTQGYTLGLQFARPLWEDGAFRIQSEVTNLEQSSTYRQRPVTTYYMSRPVPQGYTHRGQVIGAAIGPGSSSQWLASDYLTPRWQVGVYGARIRWANDTYYRFGQFRNTTGHDVSLLAGIRGSIRSRGAEYAGEIGREARYNYLFQNWSPSFDDIRAVDVNNWRVVLTVSAFRH